MVDLQWRLDEVAGGAGLRPVAQQGGRAELIAIASRLLGRQDLINDIAGLVLVCSWLFNGSFCVNTFSAADLLSSVTM